MSVTVWESEEAVRNGLGADWQKPAGTSEFPGEILAKEVAHFAAVADDLRELLEFMRLSITSARAPN